MKKEHVSAMPGGCPHINYGTAYWKGSGRASLFNSFACRKLEVRATSDTKTLLLRQLPEHSSTAVVRSLLLPICLRDKAVSS